MGRFMSCLNGNKYLKSRYRKRKFYAKNSSKYNFRWFVRDTGGQKQLLRKSHYPLSEQESIAETLCIYSLPRHPLSHNTFILSMKIISFSRKDERDNHRSSADNHRHSIVQSSLIINKVGYLGTSYYEDGKLKRTSTVKRNLEKSSFNMYVKTPMAESKGFILVLFDMYNKDIQVCGLQATCVYFTPFNNLLENLDFSEGLFYISSPLQLCL